VEVTPLNSPSRIVAGFLAIFAVAIGPVVVRAETSSPRQEWSFDQDQSGALPGQFVIGTLFDGRQAGDWQVLATDRAKSPPNVLAQLMAKGADHVYKVTLAKEVVASDVSLQVSFLPIQGNADMGGGLIWRAADDRNYYLARANPLEQNIRVYRVVKGVRHLLQNFDRTINVRQWHRLMVTHRGCQITVYYDDEQVLNVCDKTFHTGTIGLWTKSDAVTYFDDLQLQRLK
jgi:hypothetical protein